jgi:hypothetical protein
MLVGVVTPKDRVAPGLAEADNSVVCTNVAQPLGQSAAESLVGEFPRDELEWIVQIAESCDLEAPALDVVQCPLGGKQMVYSHDLPNPP